MEQINWPIFTMIFCALLGSCAVDQVGREVRRGLEDMKITIVIQENQND